MERPNPLTHLPTDPSTDNEFSRRCRSVFDRIQKERPLIHHITNIVVANDNANAMLAVGALPVMAQAVEEVEEMVAQAQSLVVNFGTLNKDVIESAILAGRKANQLNIPVVFDPVGAGATGFRTEAALQFLSYVQVAVIRANAGETAALLGEPSEVRGVESVLAGVDAARLSRRGSLRYNCVVAVTGQTDYIADKERILAISNGHELLTRLTGMGCLATSLCGACVAVEREPLLAACAALGYLGVAAERSAVHISGPGSFHTALFDWLFSLAETPWMEQLRIVERSV
ncbi:MAG TPA: hydroxyethylthiazole kinase [Atribacteraceae bacterium]|nr:hydroxyethylthiazole kinase [Atribacteraceae bacterium]